MGAGVIALRVPPGPKVPARGGSGRRTVTRSGPRGQDWRVQEGAQETGLPSGLFARERD